MGHDRKIVTEVQTYILAECEVPCSGTVVAWEFCYRSTGASVTFYPGIWKITGTTNSSINYELVQSNSVTYNAAIQTSGDDSCQRANLLTTDRFTAPEGSVVGLYSNVHSQLLHTDTDSSLTTYQFSGNQSSVSTTGNNENVRYNVSIRVHLGKYSGICNTEVHNMCAYACRCVFEYVCVTMSAYTYVCTCVSSICYMYMCMYLHIDM